MTTTNITIEQIRNLTGIDSSLLDDTTIQSNLDTVCDFTDSFFSIKTTPIKSTDFIEVIDEFSIDVKKNPLLSIKKIKQNNSEIELSDIDFSETGSIRLDYRRFYNNSFNNRNNIVYVEYLYGWLEAQDDKELTTTTLSTGSNINITVADSTQYTENEWIRIKGFDGNSEVVQVTSLPDSTTIQVDELVLTHEIGSLIEKLQKPEIIDQYILYETSIYCAINAIGGTYTFNTSYNIEGVSATKGVPYPHFEKVYNSLITQRDILKDKINGSLIRVL